MNHIVKIAWATPALSTHDNTTLHCEFTSHSYLDGLFDLYSLRDLRHERTPPFGRGHPPAESGLFAVESGLFAVDKQGRVNGKPLFRNRRNLFRGNQSAQATQGYFIRWNMEMQHRRATLCGVCSPFLREKRKGRNLGEKPKYLPCYISNVCL